MSEHSASVFDEWYGTIGANSAFDAAVTRGLDLPEGLVATGLVRGSAYREVIRALALEPQEVLLDLGCGRGSYGLAAARATPGGRVVVTCWEAAGPQADRLPDRIRRLDLATALRDGGFTDVVVLDRPSWLDHEHRHWEAALAIDPHGDAGVIGLREEAEQLLPLVPSIRRVLATAAAPGRERA